MIVNEIWRQAMWNKRAIFDTVMINLSVYLWCQESVGIKLILWTLLCPWMDYINSSLHRSAANLPGCVASDKTYLIIKAYLYGKIISIALKNQSYYQNELI